MENIKADIIKMWTSPWCLVALAVLFGVVFTDCHLRGWLKGVDHFQGQVQQAAGGVPADVHTFATAITKDSGTITHAVTEDVRVAGGAETETEKTMRLFRNAAPGFIIQFRQELDDTHNLLVDARNQLPLAGDVLKSSKKTLDDFDTLVPAANNVLLGIPAFETALTNTTTELGNFINGPLLANAVENIGTAAGNIGEITDNTNTYLYPPPYTGAHPTRHKFAVVGKAIMKLGPPLASGMAGAVALAHGN